MTSLTIRLFGELDVRVNDAPLQKVHSDKERLLLALLVLQRGRAVQRGWLAGTLWPVQDHYADQALSYLRRGLWALRKALGEQGRRLESPTPRTVRFDASGVPVDVLAFDAAIARGDPASLEAALALYRGPLLADCAEMWVTPERQARQQAYQAAVQELSQRAMAAGDYETAIRRLRRLVAEDPLWEPGQHLLMEALAKNRNPNAALHVFGAYSRLLHREHNAVPGEALRALYARIHAEQAQKRQPIRSSALPPGSAPPCPPHDLPRPLTGMIGREDDLREVKVRLGLSRLVTLTGCGGVGKTRLAIEAAEEVCAEYPDGVRFIALAPLSDPSLVAHAVASALDVRGEPGSTMIQALVGALRNKSALLVLDNCEHLVDACAALAGELLAACLDLRILATSRQALGVPGEMIWRVSPLSIPDPGAEEGQGGIAPIAGYPSVELFRQRAAAVQPGFALTPEKARAVAQICRSLDGIPLALELAAARVPVLTVEQIARRLDDRFRLLTGGGRGALPHQETLGATLDWSYNLLSEDERTLFRRLSVFAGGWTLEAAEAVCTNCDLAPDDVLDRLTRLVEQSLVVAEARGAEMRFSLLETLREYAAERLADAGESEALEARHAAYFPRFAEQMEPLLTGPEQELAWRQIEAERSNLRHAMKWLLAHAPNDALRVTAAIWRFGVLSDLSEGRAWLERVLSQTQATAAPALRAKALAGAGCLAWLQFDGAQATALCEQSLLLARQTEQMGLAAFSLGILGLCRRFLENDSEGASPLYAEGLCLARAVNDGFHTALLLHCQGLQALDQGEQEPARKLLGEALEIARDVGNPWLIALVTWDIGLQALFCNEYRRAAECFAESLKLRVRFNDRRGGAMALQFLGNTACAERRMERAARLYGAADALRAALNIPLSPIGRTPYERCVSTVQNALGAEAFAAAWGAGQALSWESAVASALEDRA